MMQNGKIKCGECGCEVSKRQSRLIDGHRVCKIHDSAKAFAEEQNKMEAQKLAKQRARRVRPIEQTSHDPRDLNTLATLYLLGSVVSNPNEESND